MNTDEYSRGLVVRVSLGTCLAHLREALTMNRGFRMADVPNGGMTAAGPLPDGRGEYLRSPEAEWRELSMAVLKPDRGCLCLQ